MTDIHIYEAGDTMRGISGDFVTLEDYKKLEAQLDAVREIVSGLKPRGLSFYETQRIKTALQGENDE